MSDLIADSTVKPPSATKPTAIVTPIRRTEKETTGVAKKNEIPETVNLESDDFSGCRIRSITPKEPLATAASMLKVSLNNPNDTLNYDVVSDRFRSDGQLSPDNKVDVALSQNKKSIPVSRKGHLSDSPVGKILEIGFRSPSKVRVDSSHTREVLLSRVSGGRDCSDVLDLCNFYYGTLSNLDAKIMLKSYPVGTFILRESSNPHFRFSLSVKTSRGTTSIRIAKTASGQLRLDTDPKQEDRMPTFPCILSLVEHYFLRESDNSSKRRGHCVFLETSGRSDTPMLLQKALEVQPAPLAHLCRRFFNHLVPRLSERQELIRRVSYWNEKQKQSTLTYLLAYPYRV